MVAHTVVEYTLLAAKNTVSDCTTTTMKQTTIVAQTAVVVVVVPPAVVVVALIQTMVVATVALSPLTDGILPSHNMHPSSFPGVNHMLHIPCLHTQ